MNAIYRNRNRIKRRYQYYAEEAVKNVAASESQRTVGKESASRFVYLSTMVVLGMLGHKFGDILSERDKREIKELRRRIAYLK